MVRKKENKNLSFKIKGFFFFLFVYSSCVCVEVDKTNTKTKGWSNKFFDKYLPQCIDSYILLTRNLQDRYMQEKKVNLVKGNISTINFMKNFLGSSSTRLYKFYGGSYE